MAPSRFLSLCWLGVLGPIALSSLSRHRSITGPIHKAIAYARVHAELLLKDEIRIATDCRFPNEHPSGPFLISGHKLQVCLGSGSSSESWLAQPPGTDPPPPQRVVRLTEVTALQMERASSGGLCKKARFYKKHAPFSKYVVDCLDHGNLTAGGRSYMYTLQEMAHGRTIGSVATSALVEPPPELPNLRSVVDVMLVLLTMRQEASLGFQVEGARCHVYFADFNWDNLFITGAGFQAIIDYDWDKVCCQQAGGGVAKGLFPDCSSLQEFKDPAAMQIRSFLMYRQLWVGLLQTMIDTDWIPQNATFHHWWYYMWPETIQLWSLRLEGSSDFELAVLSIVRPGYQQDYKDSCLSAELFRNGYTIDWASRLKDCLHLMRVSLGPSRNISIA